MVGDLIQLYAHFGLDPAAAFLARHANVLSLSQES